VPRLRNAIALSLIAIVVLTLVGVGGAYAYVRPSLPASGLVQLEGVRAPVEVLRDRWGVPHIFAHSEEDLFFAQGYVTAQDRLWQMELGRRAARGTLAEVLGEEAVPGDRLARTLGFARAADLEWAGLDADVRGALEAYARGVNAFLTTPGQRLPFEFILKGAAPAPWQPQDSLAWARLLAWCLDGDWQQEVMRARLVQAVGAARAAELDPALTGLGTAPADLGYLAALSEETLLEAGARVWPWAGGLSGTSWAVGGAKTASGAPILASAPQLPPQMPSPWYEVHLVGGRYDVIGAGLPGLPGVAMGRNRSIVWGLGKAAADTMDLYVERVRPGDRPQAEYEGGWEAMGAVEEQISVRGQAEPLRITVYTTRHGPLITPLESSGAAQVALRWSGDGRPAALVQGTLAVGRAAGWPEFEAALQEWGAPALILPYGDAQGSVGYACTGAVPERPGAGGALPVPGWAAGYEWGRLATAEELPKELRPAGSTLVVTGGVATPPGWPEQTWDDARTAAAARIIELLGTNELLTAEAAQTIQCDDRAPDQPLLALLRELPPQGWLQERTMPYVRDWDGRYDAESAGAGIYETFCWRLAHNTLDDELGAGLVDAYLDACLDHRAVLERLAAQPDSPWFDDSRTPVREGRAESIARSFADALEWLGRRFGDLPYEWNWGRVHNVTFAHALSKEGTAQRLLLSRGAMRAGGGPGSVDAVAAGYGQRMAVSAVPYRLVVDLGQGGQMRAMNSTGQSGNPLSVHYADMIQPWREGGYHPLLFEREAIGQAREAALTLAPVQ